MPSKDTYYDEHPEANDTLREDLPPQLRKSFDLARLSAISSAGRPPATAKTVLSAHVQRLARTAGESADDVAARIPDDTIRRTKYPVHEIAEPDGSTAFRHPDGVIEGVRGLLIK